MNDTEIATVRVVIKGRVQRVGFRYWVIGEAGTRNLRGWVRNHHTGDVEAVFSGPNALIEEMVTICHQGPAAAHVESIQRYPAEAPNEEGFQCLPTV